MALSIGIAYSGVHTAYQQALAATESKSLAAFYCSVAPGAGRYGDALAKLIGKKKLLSRNSEGIARSAVYENPVPLAMHAMRCLFTQHSQNDWFDTNEVFDKWVASKIATKPMDIFIGFETCALYSLQAAKSVGGTTVVESPQAHPQFLNRVLSEGASRIGLKLQQGAGDARMAERRDKEFSLADHFLVYSDIHARSFVDAGFPRDRIHITPLWADPSIWNPQRKPVRENEGPLQVLFVGSVSLRKGIPWLLEAMQILKNKVALTIVGSIDEEMRPLLDANAGSFKHLPAQPRHKLVEIYQNADVFILPSLLDTFGYVAMEAMMSGLPAIVSENSGCPVPDESWRIPVMNSTAIADKLQQLSDNRQELRNLAEIAIAFSKDFTNIRYRKKLNAIFNAIEKVSS